jgi:hypothetical protein
LALLVIVGGLVYIWPVNRDSGFSEMWAQGQDPEHCPIVAFWVIDGRPEVVICVREGAQYYTYNPGGIVLLLYTFPPLWWAPMPGGAR